MLDPCRELERRGWRVTYLPPDGGGVLDPDQVAAALRPDTVLVSLMHVNNEIGVVQDIAAIGAICAEHGGARLHVDAAQSVGKCAVDFAALGADLHVAVGAQGVWPKGVGALVVRSAALRGRGCTYASAIRRRTGAGICGRARVATHQVVGMGMAFELARGGSRGETARIAQLQQRLWQGLAALGGVLRNGNAERSVPHLLNVSFEGVEGESLLAAVRPHLAVSTGSACTSALAEPSYVLRALGRGERLERKQPAVRPGPQYHRADIDTAVAVVDASIERLRRRRHCRRMNYNELTRRYFETAAARGRAWRSRVFIAAPRETANTAPGCNSKSRSTSGIRSRRRGSWPLAARTPSPWRLGWPSRRLGSR